MIEQIFDAFLVEAGPDRVFAEKMTHGVLALQDTMMASRGGFSVPRVAYEALLGRGQVNEGCNVEAKRLIYDLTNICAILRVVQTVQSNLRSVEEQRLRDRSVPSETELMFYIAGVVSNLTEEDADVAEELAPTLLPEFFSILVEED